MNVRNMAVTSHGVRLESLTYDLLDSGPLKHKWSGWPVDCLRNFGRKPEYTACGGLVQRSGPE